MAIGGLPLTAIGGWEGGGVLWLVVLDDPAGVVAVEGAVEAEESGAGDVGVVE